MDYLDAWSPYFAREYGGDTLCCDLWLKFFITTLFPNDGTALGYMVYASAKGWQLGKGLVLTWESFPKLPKVMDMLLLEDVFMYPEILPFFFPFCSAGHHKIWVLPKHLLFCVIRINFIWLMGMVLGWARPVMCLALALILHDKHPELILQLCWEGELALSWTTLHLRLG